MAERKRAYALHRLKKKIKSILRMYTCMTQSNCKIEINQKKVGEIK